MELITIRASRRLAIVLGAATLSLAVALPSAALAGPPKDPKAGCGQKTKGKKGKAKRNCDGRMTGGGSIFVDGVRVTHGFQLRCNRDAPQSLQINWAGNRFHLEDAPRPTCLEYSPFLRPRNANTGELTGTGTGRLNGVSGYQVTFRMTDVAEPGGVVDVFEFAITEADGDPVFSGGGVLDRGNHQFHHH